jgi:type II secretory pathway pseudopilin PulG
MNAHLRNPFRTTSQSLRAMTLVELIGVLAVIAILAAVLVPALIRQADKAAGDLESARLKSFSDAFQSSILRSRYITNETGWATVVARELGIDIAAVTTSPRKQTRFLLIDPNLSINGAGLPYTQNSAGCANLPASPRVMFLSSISRDLPAGISNGVASDANFSNIWNAADGTVPSAAPAFSSWSGTGDDLKIQRLNFSWVFVHLLLTKYASTNTALYSIDSTNLAGVVSGIGTNAYFIQNSILSLGSIRSGANSLDSQQVLIRDNSFVFNQNVWRGSIGGGFFLGGLDIATTVDNFLSAPPNFRAQNGASQQGIVVTNMIIYMDAYDNWANAGFPKPGATYTAAKNAFANMMTAAQGLYSCAGSATYCPTNVPCN